MERKEFLGRVKSALRGATLPDVAGPDAAPSVVFADPVGRFLVEATAASADVVRVADAAAALQAVDDVFAEADTAEFLAWDGLEAVVPGWDDWVAASGRVRVDTTISSDADQRGTDNARVGGASIGITAADWGIAASGSVALSHGRGRPRTASLLVAHHVVLLPVSRILSSLSEALERVSWEGNSNVAVITGPSKTGDIESILTIGVHGPGHMHIILIG